MNKEKPYDFTLKIIRGKEYTTIALAGSDSKVRFESYITRTDNKISDGEIHFWITCQIATNQKPDRLVISEATGKEIPSTLRLLKEIGIAIAVLSDTEFQKLCIKDRILIGTPAVSPFFPEPYFPKPGDFLGIDIGEPLAPTQSTGGSPECKRERLNPFHPMYGHPMWGHELQKTPGKPERGSK